MTRTARWYPALLLRDALGRFVRLRITKEVRPVVRRVVRRVQAAVQLALF